MFCGQEAICGQETVGVKKPRSHRPSGNTCQWMRGLHHRDVERADKPLDLLHKIRRLAEFASEEDSLGDTVD